MKLRIRPKSHYYESGYIEWQPIPSYQGRWYTLSQVNIIPKNEAYNKLIKIFTYGVIFDKENDFNPIFTKGDPRKLIVVCEGEYDKTNKILTIHKILNIEKAYKCQR